MAGAAAIRRKEAPWLATSASRVLGGDPVPGLLASSEPAARWVTRTAVLGQPAGHPEVAKAPRGRVRGPRTAALIARLPDWTDGTSCPVSRTPGSRPTC